MTTAALAPLIGLLVGWLAGGAANWAADVLPRLRNEPAAPGPVRHPLHWLTLAWYPWQRGRCPHCAARLGLRAPLVELAAAALGVWAWLRAGHTPLSFLLLILYMAYLLAVLVIDLEHRRVLDVMSAPAALLALAASLLPGQPGLVPALLGGGICLGLFLLLAVLGRVLMGRSAMGQGDIKLAGVIGLMLGWPAGLTAILAGVLLAGVPAAVLLALRRVGRRSYIAYAPYLSIGALLALYGLIGVTR